MTRRVLALWGLLLFSSFSVAGTDYIKPENSKHSYGASLMDGAQVGTDCFKPENSKHPIDVWEEKEMDKTEGVTASIRDVQGQVYKKWDEELNRLYQKLMSKLPKEKKALLRESQRNWLKFRDTEYDLLNRAIYAKGGTLSTVVVGSLGNEIVRTRALQLKGHIMALDCPP